MYWTLELASKLEDAPWPATKEELLDYATRSGAPLEVLENLQEIEDEGDVFALVEIHFECELYGLIFGLAHSAVRQLLDELRLRLNLGIACPHHLERTACVGGGVAGHLAAEAVGDLRLQALES